VADCFPVYFFDPVSNTVGLAHSGWRGTVGNIAGEMVKAIAAKSADVIAGIGPGIQVCHFEIKDDILSEFVKYPEAIINSEGKFFVDLPKIISRQLIEAGLKSQNIESSGECTFCLKEKYFSFRRDKPKNVEAMVAYIGLL
jgi:YfiH family protein